MVVKPDEQHMREALKEAEQALASRDRPVGAVIVHKGQMIARAHHQVKLLRDPTAHAGKHESVESRPLRHSFSERDRYGKGKLRCPFPIKLQTRQTRVSPPEGEPREARAASPSIGRPIGGGTWVPPPIERPSDICRCERS